MPTLPKGTQTLVRNAVDNTPVTLFGHPLPWTRTTFVVSSMTTTSTRKATSSRGAVPRASILIWSSLLITLTSLWTAWVMCCELGSSGICEQLNEPNPSSSSVEQNPVFIANSRPLSSSRWSPSGVGLNQRSPLKSGFEPWTIDGTPAPIEEENSSSLRSGSAYTGQSHHFIFFAL